MKLILTIDPAQSPILSGYTIISPLQGQNPLHIDKWVDDGEADEIILDGVLRHVALNQLHTYVSSVAKKLKIGGKLIVYDLDLMEVVYGYYIGTIDTLQLNNLLFGEKQHSWDFKLSAIRLDEIEEITTSLGLTILNKQFHNRKYSITIQRV